MKAKYWIGAAAAVACLGAGMASADTIQLTGVIRDFKVEHPDMQYETANIGVKTGLVLRAIGPDGKPQLSTGTDYKKGMIAGPKSFNQWFNDVPGVNIAMPFTITLDNKQEGKGGTYSFAVEKQQVVNGKPQYFFPIDGKGWNDKAKDKNGDYRNFYFTYEIHTEFTFTKRTERPSDMVFTFTGDDDVWVYINGKLAVDIGGVHAQATKTVNLDLKAAELGLEPGKTYPLDFFFAERYTSESNFRIETTMQLKEIPPTTISPLYD